MPTSPLVEKKKLYQCKIVVTVKVCDVEMFAISRIHINH